MSNRCCAGGAPHHESVRGLRHRVPPAAGRRTAIVVFEDVHWADAATLDLLRYVGRRIQRIRALIIVTWRADEVGADHPLHRLLGELPPPRRIGLRLRRCRSTR